MAILSSEQFNKGLTKVAKHAAVFRNMVQEMLISSAFYAYKEGSTTEFNRLLSAVGEGTHKSSITRWIELVSGIGRVKGGQIVLNKKVRDESGVTDYASFQQYEDDMRAVNWWETEPEQRLESVFDEGAYMNRVYKKLISNGYAGLADALKQSELVYLAQAAAALRDEEEVVEETAE